MHHQEILPKKNGLQQNRMSQNLHNNNKPPHVMFHPTMLTEASMLGFLSVQGQDSSIFHVCMLAHWLYGCIHAMHLGQFDSTLTAMALSYGRLDQLFSEVPRIRDGGICIRI